MKERPEQEKYKIYDQEVHQHKGKLQRLQVTFVHRGSVEEQRSYAAG